MVCGGKIFWCKRLQVLNSWEVVVKMVVMFDDCLAVVVRKSSIIGKFLLWHGGYFPLEVSASGSPVILCNSNSISTTSKLCLWRVQFFFITLIYDPLIGHIPETSQAWFWLLRRGAAVLVEGDADTHGWALHPCDGFALSRPDARLKISPENRLGYWCWPHIILSHPLPMSSEHRCA